MDKDFTLKNVFDSLKPEQKKAISALVGMAMVTPFIAAIGVKPGVHEYTKYRTIYKPQKNIDCDIRSKRSELRKDKNRSAAVVCDSYISWMAQTSMDSIMEAYNEYKELGM